MTRPINHIKIKYATQLIYFFYSDFKKAAFGAMFTKDKIMLRTPLLLKPGQSNITIDNK